MQARPPGVRIFIILGGIVWIGVTIAAVVSVINAPAENVGLAIGIGLIWLVLLAFAAVERWTGGRDPTLKR